MKISKSVIVAIVVALFLALVASLLSNFSLRTDLSVQEQEYNSALADSKELLEKVVTDYKIDMRDAKTLMDAQFAIIEGQEKELKFYENAEIHVISLLLDGKEVVRVPFFVSRGCMPDNINFMGAFVSYGVGDGCEMKFNYYKPQSVVTMNGHLLELAVDGEVVDSFEGYVKISSDMEVVADNTVLRFWSVVTSHEPIEELSKIGGITGLPGGSAAE